MNLVVIAAVILGLCLVRIHANIVLKAKFMGNHRVEGDGYSVYALSVPHCLALCNKNKSCDGVTYNDEFNKCRMFRRCAPLQILNNNSHYSFYAKRPPVSNENYVYEEKSDTCLKLTDEFLPYAMANTQCKKDKGHLAVLSTVELRQLAKEILHNSGYSEAWINPSLKSLEKHARNHELRKKRRISLEDHEGKMDFKMDQCWSVRNHSIIIQSHSSCEDLKRLSICQLPTY